jgi:hypothetical protein
LNQEADAVVLLLRVALVMVVVPPNTLFCPLVLCQISEPSQLLPERVSAHFKHTASWPFSTYVVEVFSGVDDELQLAFWFMVKLWVPSDGGDVPQLESDQENWSFVAVDGTLAVRNQYSLPTA